MDFLNFLKFDVATLIHNVQPFVFPWGWIVLIIVGFLRMIPVIGVILSRIPIFTIVCFLAPNVGIIFIATAVYVVTGLSADFFTLTKSSNFWKRVTDKVSSNENVARVIQYYKRYPVLITIIGTYSAYSACFLTPLAKRFEINMKSYLIWRYLTYSITLILYGLLYFYIGINIPFFNDFISNFAVIIVLILMVYIFTSIFYLFKYSKQLNIVGFIKSFFSKTN